ncbi:P-type ATPase, cytoplasmic domain N [Trema orientale]|uniref:P-type ATPase, cytoplasmic domain N n=1 Tax=Trema orientale TaxID=63057 RepID=A0A2P5ADU9_TREOI|nr:P-type ATPase, cytoplasmic domain N [Trema orientale]
MGAIMESHCSSINKQRWLKIRNRRRGCGLKAEIKISETFENPNRLLFRCPKGTCRFFEWWRIEDDETYFNGNKWDITATDTCEVMQGGGDSIGGVRFSGRVSNAIPYLNEKIDHEMELMMLRRLVALETNMVYGSNKITILHVEALNSQKKRSGVLMKRKADNTIWVHWKGAAKMILAMCSSYYDASGINKDLLVIIFLLILK